MFYYKNKKTKEIYAYETEDEKKQFGSKGLIKMTEKEIENHINPVSTKEQLEAQKRSERNRLLDEMDLKVQIYNEQKKIGTETLSDDEYILLLKYKQYLRDITSEKDFPNIEILNWDVYYEKNVGK